MKALRIFFRFIIWAVILTTAFFASTYQPLEITQINREITCAECRGQKTAPCRTCKATGKVDQPIPCPTCDGTGKGEWKLGPRQDTAPKSIGPACMDCRGSGRSTKSAPCPACNGNRSGKCQACSGTGNVMDQSESSYKLGLALWERLLQKAGQTPPANPAPWRFPILGKYPSVEKYLLVKATPSDHFSILEWGKASALNKGWVVRVVMDWQTNGTSEQRTLLVFIRNRSIESAQWTNPGPDTGQP